MGRLAQWCARWASGLRLTPPGAPAPTPAARRRQTLALAALALLALVGALTVGRAASTWALQFVSSRGLYFPGHGVPALHATPVSKLPGPPRGEPLAFELSSANASRMRGRNHPALERWADIAGNFYAAEFIRRFSYEDASADGPQVWVRLTPAGPTLAGRLEARHLKPNFAYQMKLVGSWTEPRQAEAIGYRGRWRLPGPGTNFSDDEFRAHPRKEQVEAYILFDFFVTDAAGHAVREFALDSTLHVLWNGTRQWQTSHEGDVLELSVAASDPQVYARPKRTPSVERLWAERERQRYPRGEQTIRLPPGPYFAFLWLTEESFHASERDGGYWATVCSLPIQFTITADAPAPTPAPAPAP